MNKLHKYYRKPNAYVNLPTRGELYSLSEDEASMMDEVGVLRMTMMNQLSANNPESLVNGQTVEELIRDCTTIQNIQPRSMFKCDVDALIMGIRMVSVDDVMNVDLVCPSCETQNTYGVDLSNMISEMTFHEKLPYEFPIPSIPDIVLHLVPSTLESALRIDQTFFQDAKEIEHIRRNIKASSSNVNDITEDELESLQGEMKAHVERIHSIQRNMTFNTMRLYADCVTYADTPEGTVEDKDDIFEFITELTADDHDALKSKISEINKVGVPKHQMFKCPSCEHEYEAPVEVNPTDFFGNGSR